MKAFYGSRFSPNMTETPEGFLIAHNVPISRAGWYEYLPDEIGVEDSGVVKVFRDPAVVFSPVAMASFEGKPLTDDHPPNGVSPEDARIYVKGAVQNVRRGAGSDADLLLADLIVYDERLIQEIRDGKREVSAGYECEYEPRGDGAYEQTGIIGNHVAVVDSGRAGDRVRIKDHQPADAGIENGQIVSPDDRRRKGNDRMAKVKLPAQKQSRVTDFLAAIGLKHFATDAEPEELMNAVDAMAGEKIAEEEGATAQACDAADPKLAELEAKIDKCLAMCEAMCKTQDTGPAPEDAIDAVIQQLGDPENAPARDGECCPNCGAQCSSKYCPECGTQCCTTDEDVYGEGNTLSPQFIDDDAGVVASPDERVRSGFNTIDKAAKIAALRAIKPIIAAIQDPVQRKKASDAAIASIKGMPTVNTYAQITQSVRKRASDNAAQQKQQQDQSNLGREWAQKFNPHYKAK